MKEKAINGDEQDWISKRWRHLLCVFKNITGLGKTVKRRMNKRSRRRIKLDLKNFDR